MTSTARSHLASFFGAVAVVSVAVMVGWAQHALDGPEQHTDELVAQLCAHGADPHLCAQAGLPQGIHYVSGRGSCTVSVIPARWPQMAEPALTSPR